MTAVKAKFDGKQVVLPPDFLPSTEQDVIVVFQESGSADESDRQLWTKASTDVLKKVWENTDDEIYDKL